MNIRTMNETSSLTRFLGLAASLAAAAGLFLGCSGNVSSPTSGVGGTLAAVSVPVMITDAPSDQLVAFTLTLNSIVLTNSAGKTVSILATPTSIEVCHLNGVQEALITASIPQDTYVSAAFTFSNPQITYINSAGAPVSVTPTLSTTSYTTTFSSPIVISNSSTSLLVDLLASQSVTISGTTVTVSPVFSVKPISASAVPTAGHNGTGMEQHGTVVSASGTTLVIQPPSGSNVTFTTNSSTIYQGVSALAGLAAGQLVEVDFSVQTGGVLLASRVELEPQPPTGQAQNRLNGPVTTAPAGTTSFKMALMQSFGTAVSPTATGSIYTVNFTTSTIFAAAPQFASLSGLPFTPTFTAATLKAGQAVGVTASSITGTTATATSVYLIPQTLSGTIAAITTSGSWKVYTLTLTSGSAFATLSGATTVTVYTNSATTPMATSTIAVGSAVRFNGLVFNNGGSFAMVAGCSPDGDPSH